ncbi:MAG: DNA replication/repair protein RecF [Myxococcota bacterium]
MRVERLTARGFRNLESLDLTIAPGFVIIEGRNGQGKTNLLEALYVCATGRSFRGSPPRELVRHSGESSQLDALFVRQSVRHQVEVNIAKNRRTVRVDGRGLRKTSQLLDLVNVVAFFPDDLRVIKGSPEERRRFLDRSAANFKGALVDAAASYEKALRSRNRLLRDERRVDPAMLEVYDEQLCRFGEVIHQCRLEALGKLRPEAQRVFGDLMDEGLEITLDLDSGIPGLVDTDFRQGFIRALGASHQRDVARGSTSVGPHRGDLIVRLNGHDARSFGSQGQQRAAVLSLKLAEVRILAVELDSPPILLLDDVSSELDVERTQALFGSIESLQTQVWVSTTGAAPLPLPDTAQRLRMASGKLTEMV